MFSINKVYLLGNVGNTPKSGTTKNGHTWANMPVATQKKKKDEYETTWHYVVGWGKTADMMASLKKGDTVFVEGELHVNQYEKDGAKVIQVQVVANQVLKGAKKEAGEELFGPEHESGFEGEQGF